MWKTITYEICGRNHQRTGAPCQDKTLAICKNNVQVISLADGAGSARYSHYGAETTLKAASESVADNFERLSNISDANSAKKLIHENIKNALELEAQRLSCRYKDLASTLLLVAAKENNLIMIHVGDGVIGCIKNKEPLVLSHPYNGEFANTTVFLTSPDVLTCMKLTKGTLDNISGFVLMSDGTAESFYHKRNKTLATVTKRYISWTALLTTQKMQSLVADAFKDIIITKTHDDCSIAIMAPASSQLEEFHAMSTFEKCYLLGINNSYPNNANKQIKKYSKILQCLEQPKTLTEVAKATHLKPKHARRSLTRLVDRGIITKNQNSYKLS